MEETLAELQVLDGDQVATACRTTLNILVQNAMENVENKIFEVLDIIAEKVCVMIRFVYDDTFHILEIIAEFFPFYYRWPLSYKGFSLKAVQGLRMVKIAQKT